MFREPEDNWITFPPPQIVDAGSFHEDGLWVGVGGDFPPQFGVLSTGSAFGSYYQEGVPDIGVDQNGSVGIEAFGTAFPVVIEVDITSLVGTDRLGMDLNPGNISQYLLFNFVNNGNVAIAAFGTHFNAIVPGGDMGTNSTGTIGWSVFGTHLAVTVYLDIGTDSMGTLGWAAYGTANLVVFSSDAGTDANGTTAIQAYGTATFLVPYWGTFVDTNGTSAFTAFGDYTST